MSKLVTRCRMNERELYQALWTVAVDISKIQTVDYLLVFEDFAQLKA